MPQKLLVEEFTSVGFEAVKTVDDWPNRDIPRTTVTAPCFVSRAFKCGLKVRQNQTNPLVNITYIIRRMDTF